LTSSLFPQLPERSRISFRIALIVLIAALASFATMRWSIPMLGTALSGLPLLFVIYLHEIGARKAIPIRYLAAVTILAIVLGVGWALIAGPAIADAYNSAAGGAMTVGQEFVWWVVIPFSEALLMVAPGVLVRVVDRTRRDPLDGFTIGALGALVANSASTATLLAPQLAMGVTTDTEPVHALIVEALVEGLAWPTTALATGGIFGIALRIKPPANTSRRSRWLRSAALLAVLANLTVMAVIDVLPISLNWYLGLQLFIAALAVLALRITLTRDSDAVVPVTPSRKSAYLRVLGPLTAGVGVTVAIGIAVATTLAPIPEHYVCPPDCGKPPLGDPVETNPRFSGDDGAFSVAYPGEGSAYEVTFDPPGINGVQLNYVGGDTGVLTLFGEQAGERTPEQVAQQLLSSKYPGATVDYEIPNASVGYQPGYGVVADVYPRDTSSGYSRLRVIIMAAVRYDYALIAMASGPFHKFSPSYGTGHPSAANLEVAMDMGKYVNSFRWNGDRYGRPS
jgi:hypothetical protein